MASPIYTQILEAMKARLLEIVGDGGESYFHTPFAVLIYPALTKECLRSDMGNPATIYVITPGLEEIATATMGPQGRERSDAVVDLALAQYFVPQTEDPFNPPSPTRIEIQSQLARDAEKALLRDFVDGVVPTAGVFGLLDPVLGNVITNVTVEAKDRTAENTWEEGWALVYLSVRLLFHYLPSAP